MTLDFSLVNWIRWTTDAWYAQAQFISDITLLPEGQVYPPFKFDMRISAADHVALMIDRAHRRRELVQIINGPLGGGSFYVTYRHCPHKNGVEQGARELEAGEPVMFELTLTGRPPLADLIDKKRKEVPW